MIRNNKDLRLGVLAFLIGTIVFSLIGFLISDLCGWLILTNCIVMFSIYIATELCRYRKLQKLSQGLDDLLISGQSLAIHEYDEGELSILADQIQKVTLRLTESAETVKADKEYLADSLADISHQLKTPLTAINIIVSMLRRPSLTDEDRLGLIIDLQRQLDRIEWLVETLLKISKLDAGTVKLARDNVSVRELIYRSSAPLAIPLDLRNQKLIVKCAEEHFTGDLIWSAEALGNILKNCMEHTHEGGIITVTAQETALYTQIEVTDTGSGFDSKDIPHLFERFYKGSNASESSYGIGLALARSVIVSQNGTIQAMNSKPGAKFVILFYKQVI